MADGHGGKRPGSGRKRGAKQKVTEESLKRAGEGDMPLEYMLRVMRDTGAEEKRRDAMAIAAAAYIHPKLSSVTGTFKHQHDPSDLTDADLAHIAASSSAGVADEADGEEGSSHLH